MKEENKVILNLTKNTLGYLEAENKQSFITGAEVCLSLIEISKDRDLEYLEKQLKAKDSMYQDLKKDMEMLTGIIHKYINND
jgi:RNA polymerase-interacting CarD/CdnL/TRCF family regulator